MSKPTNFHDIPRPSGEISNRNRMESSVDNPSVIAKLWRPLKAMMEVPISTLSRHALRLIDRTSGMSYSADELMEKMGAMVPIGLELPRNAYLQIAGTAQFQEDTEPLYFDGAAVFLGTAATGKRAWSSRYLLPSYDIWPLPEEDTEGEITIFQEGVTLPCTWRIYIRRPGDSMENAGIFRGVGLTPWDVTTWTPHNDSTLTDILIQQSAHSTTPGAPGDFRVTSAGFWVKSSVEDGPWQKVGFETQLPT